MISDPSTPACPHASSTSSARPSPRARAPRPRAFASLTGLALLALGALGMLASTGCGRRGSLLDAPAAGPGESARGGARPATPTTPGARGPTSRPAAGSSCMGREDCPSDQVCVEAVCRYRETSVAGEVLATAARGQVEAGDWEGAIRTYDQAIEHFETAHAAVPPDILCASAELILRTATEPEGRERGARRADACFRGSLPGAPVREEVRRAVARLRFEGLDSALFDRTEPAERFFTQEPSRPTVDALEIDLQIAESDDPGAAQLREQLAGEAARRAIGECFVQDWELRHERSATASLIVRYSTRLVDMGSYDRYEGRVSIEKTTVAEDGFEPCLARALSGTLTPPPSGRVVAWQTSMTVAVRVR
jgi:hypothetical protein